MTAIGIDVAKHTLAVDAVLPDGKRRQKHCANSAAGHAELIRWIGRHAVAPVAIGLEATGGYQEAVAIALHEAGYAVSVLNPSRIAAYGQSQLRRAKTDPTDAALIADFVRTQTPPVWTPPPPEMRQLQALVRRLDALLEMQTQERNRLDLAAPIVKPSISIRRSARNATWSSPFRGSAPRRPRSCLANCSMWRASPARGRWRRLRGWSPSCVSRERRSAAEGPS